MTTSSVAAESQELSTIASMREALHEQRERMCQLWDDSGAEEPEFREDTHAAMRHFTTQLIQGGDDLSEFSLPPHFGLRRQEELFEEIIRLFDMTDEIIATVAQVDVVNRPTQLELASPFFAKVYSSATFMAAFYIDVVRCDRPVTPALQDAFEKASQDIFNEFTVFLEGVEEKLTPDETSLSSAVVDRLKSNATLSSHHKETLAEKYQRRPQGTRQIKAKSLAGGLNARNGAALVNKTAETARHMAQLAIEMIEIGFVTNFNNACPEGGLSSKRARQLAPIERLRVNLLDLLDDDNN
jgi:hypothetical protein